MSLFLNEDDDFPRREQVELLANDDVEGQSTHITVVAPADLQEGSVFDATVRGRILTVTVPSAGVRRGQQIRVPVIRLARVVSPATVAEGEEVDVRVGGRTLTVRAPPGGVNRGETFEIRAPRGSDSLQDNDSSRSVRRDGLFDCFRFGCFHPSICMSCWCPLIALGQLLTRLNLSWTGRKLSRKTTTSFVTLALMSLLVLKLELFVSTGKANLQLRKTEKKSKAYPHYDVQEDAFVFYSTAESVMATSLWLFTVFVLWKVRKHLRSRNSNQNEGAEDDDDETTDFFKSCCCPVLTSAQLMRRTADYTQVKGTYFTLDGLEETHDVSAAETA